MFQQERGMRERIEGFIMAAKKQSKSKSWRVNQAALAVGRFPIDRAVEGCS
jgi:hypothetical protein